MKLFAKLKLEDFAFSSLSFHFVVKQLNYLKL